MARKNARKPRNLNRNRIENLTPEEIQKRWQTLTPMFLKGVLGCVAGAAGLFFYNRYAHPGQQTVDILNVCFQILVAGTICFGALAAMALFYGQGKTGKSAA